MLSTGMRVLITGHKGFLGQHVIRAVTARGCQWVGMDLGDDLPDEPIDGIIHLAALNGVRACDAAPVDAVETNMLLTARMLMLAKQSDAWFVHVSSQEARDNIYGITKRAAESYARAWSRLTQVPVSFVQPCTMFGRGMRADAFIERVRRGDVPAEISGALIICPVERVVDAILRVCGEHGRIEYIQGDTIGALTLAALIRHVADSDPQ